MLRPRVIPVLLVDNGRLVKTQKFDNPRYIGDPVNAVRIFNEKSCDEMVLLDINVSANNGVPDYEMISKCASECRMPLCYGGGIQSVEQIKRIINLGVEKVAINSVALKEPGIIEEAANLVGRQSIVGVMDIAYDSKSRKYTVTSNRGRNHTNWDPISWSKQLELRGAGEILVNSVDRDGTMAGFDLVLAEMIRASVNIPITILGGAGSIQHIEELFSSLGVTGAGCGSLFVFKGRLRAVLINYPEIHELDRLCEFAWQKI
jgi:cyclase